MATNTKTLRQKPQKTTLANTDAVPITDASGNVYYMNVSNLRAVINPTTLNGKTQKHIGEILPTNKSIANVGWYRIGQSLVHRTSGSSALISIGQTYDSGNGTHMLLAVTADYASINAVKLTHLEQNFDNISKVRWVITDTTAYIDIYVNRQSTNSIGVIAFGSIGIYDTFEYEPDTTGISRIYEATL